jgi:hypothetical protein
MRCSSVAGTSAGQPQKLRLYFGKRRDVLLTSFPWMRQTRFRNVITDYRRLNVHQKLIPFVAFFGILLPFSQSRVRNQFTGWVMSAGSHLVGEALGKIPGQTEHCRCLI